MPKGRVPFTESERDILFRSGLTNTELAERFGCSRTTIRRTKQRIIASNPGVYELPLSIQEKKRRHFLISDRASYSELCESSLGLNYASACDAHLEDLRRVHGSGRR